MIEVRFVVDEPSVKSATALAFTMLEESGTLPLEVHVREVRS